MASNISQQHFSNVCEVFKTKKVRFVDTLENQEHTISSLPRTILVIPV